MIEMSEHRVLVLGAGYAGMTAALRLARRTRRADVRVTLVNPVTRFTERVRLHQTATGQDLADLQIPEMLHGSGVEFVQGWVTGVDAAAGAVALDGGRVLAYDRLVYALGGVTDTQSVPGVAEHAYTFDDASCAVRLAEHLAAPAAGSVVVVGAGLTGVESAAEIAESYPDVRVVLVGGQGPGAMMGAKARSYVEAALERLGVAVRVGAEVTKVLPAAVELAGGEVLDADAVLWTCGVRASTVAGEAGMAVDERGRIVTDAYLRSVSHTNVYAVGDAAVIEQNWGTMHGTCGAAVPSAIHAADSIARELRGGKPRPFRYGYVHQPVSLGRHDAVIQFTRPDERPRRAVLTGRRAVTYKEAFCALPLPGFKFISRYGGPIPLPRGGSATRGLG
jgi:NADH dehydrogenase FAD-containing subunit